MLTRLLTRLTPIFLLGAGWLQNPPSASNGAEILIADRLTNSVYRYSPAGQFLGVLLTDNTNLNGPDGIQISPDLAELYVSSSGNDNLVRYDFNYSTDAVSNPTVIASTAQGLSFPSSITFNAADSIIYVASLNQYPPAGVARLTLNGAVAGTPLVGGSIRSYSGLALGPDGSLVVGGFNDGTQSQGGVLKSNPAITAISDLVPPATSLSGVAAVLVHGNDVYVTSGFSGQVSAFNVTTGAPDPSFTTIKPLSFPAGITLTPDGQNLLIASLGVTNGGGKVSRYDLSGAFIGDFATAQADSANGFREATSIVTIPDVTPVSGNWIVNVNGLYGIESNWDTGRRHNGRGATSTFGSSSGVTGAGPSLIATVNGAYTTGSLVFNNPNVSYTLAADGNSSHVLTLDSGAGGAATITVVSGSHTISAPLSLANGLTVTTATDPGENTPALTISGPIGGNGDLVKMGHGTLTINGPTSFGANTAITVSDTGTLTLAPSTATINSMVIATINPGAKLELTGAASSLGSADPTTRAHVIDSGTLIASSAGQIVGRVDGGNTVTPGLGSVVIADTSSLQVDGILVSSLSIGNGSTLTLAATDAMGNPTSTASLTGESSSLGLTVLLPWRIDAARAPFDLAGSDSASSFGSEALGGSYATVPEPSSLTILVLGCLAGAAYRLRSRQVAPNKSGKTLLAGTVGSWPPRSL